jgi:putative transposase
MKSNPDRHHRRSVRLRGYDYTQAGAYYVTICIHRRECLLGSVINGAMQLSEYGHVAQLCWQTIPEHFMHVNLDAFVVMPNHVHGILHIAESSSSENPAPERFAQPVSGSLATIIRSYKAAVTKSVNALRDMSGASFWQRSYYDQIIRDRSSLLKIREYIAYNPLRWQSAQPQPKKPANQ